MHGDLVLRAPAAARLRLQRHRRVLLDPVVAEEKHALALRGVLPVGVQDAHLHRGEVPIRPDAAAVVFDFDARHRADVDVAHHEHVLGVALEVVGVVLQDAHRGGLALRTDQPNAHRSVRSRPTHVRRAHRHFIRAHRDGLLPGGRERDVRREMRLAFFADPEARGEGHRLASLQVVHLELGDVP